ncbi:hypothetical protein WME79_42790 [Sorangium sp. So ce726]|uniref:hypothetical protein n=1 Tax=Sorangium sp. So ce726 TaxID=3133319 RepID=UPI003F6264DD
MMTSCSSILWVEQHAKILNDVRERYRACLAVYSPEILESERDELAADDGAVIAWALHRIAIADGFPELRPVAPDATRPHATGQAVSIPRSSAARLAAHGGAAAAELRKRATC